MTHFSILWLGTGLAVLIVMAQLAEDDLFAWRWWKDWRNPAVGVAIIVFWPLALLVLKGRPR